MACGHCGKNQAVKTYEEIKNGKKKLEYYCLDCYHRLFLYAEEAEGVGALSACPYCGTTKAEIENEVTYLSLMKQNLEVLKEALN